MEYATATVRLCIADSRCPSPEVVATARVPQTAVAASSTPTYAFVVARAPEGLATTIQGFMIRKLAAENAHEQIPAQLCCAYVIGICVTHIEWKSFTLSE